MRVLYLARFYVKKRVELSIVVVFGLAFGVRGAESLVVSDPRLGLKHSRPFILEALADVVRKRNFALAHLAAAFANLARSVRIKLDSNIRLDAVKDKVVVKLVLVL